MCGIFFIVIALIKMNSSSSVIVVLLKCAEDVNLFINDIISSLC